MEGTAFELWLLLVYRFILVQKLELHMVYSQWLYVCKLANLKFACYLILELHWPHDLHTFTSFPCSLRLRRLITRCKLLTLILRLNLFICLSWEEISKHCKYARLLFAWMTWIERVRGICACNKVFFMSYQIQLEIYVCKNRYISCTIHSVSYMYIVHIVQYSF